MYIQKTFEQSGNYDLFPEFIETLVNDTSIPEKTRRQIWTLVSCENWGGPFNELAVIDVVASFQDSEDGLDLSQRWTAIVHKHWPRLPNCPLKKEIDSLN